MLQQIDPAALEYLDKDVCLPRDESGETDAEEPHEVR